MEPRCDHDDDAITALDACWATAATSSKLRAPPLTLLHADRCAPAASREQRARLTEEEDMAASLEDEMQGAEGKR
jgi:hypothetical protein